MIVDASVWISSLTIHEVNHQASRRWLRIQTASNTGLTIPSIALPEVAGAIARRDNSTRSGREAIRWMLRISGIQVASIPDALAHRAAEIAADYQLRGADAVYVAVAEELGLPLVTLDQELQQRAEPIVAVIQP